jgi:integration host factor subunit beta
LAVVKSKLVKQLKKSFPNIYTKDLDKLVSIILKEIKSALKRGENVELRNFGTWKLRTQKQSIRRNPRNGEKINVPEKKTIYFKMTKDLFKKLNNEEK